MLLSVGFIEALQDFIADNSGLGLTVGSAGISGNLTVGNLLNVDDLETLLGSEIVCTLFEEGGNIVRTGRRHRQERGVRFVYKGTHGQGAVNSCWTLLQFLENQKSFSTTDFTVWIARTDKLPGVIAADRGGTHLADFVMTFFVQNRTG